ncbi:MAG: glutathione peroxidase [Luteolibacter sp.]
MNFRSLFARLLAVTCALCVTAIAADLTKIPFADAEGKPTSLAAYSGQVVLIVNTASKCGLTKQYSALEALYRKYRDKGFVVLAFPCNDFRNQEPGSIAEIQQFCKERYDVTFPIMGKLSVKGEKRHALYTALTGPEGAFPGEVTWNFGKFLIARDGKPLARFESRTAPDSPEVIAAIEKALAP